MKNVDFLQVGEELRIGVFQIANTAAIGIGVTVQDQFANMVYAGPESGPPDTPDFRPLIMDDLPAPMVWASVRIKADGTLQIWNPDQSTFHSLLVRGAAGAEYLEIGAGEA